MDAGEEPAHSGFRLEKECLGFVEELRAAWKELPVGVRRYAARGKTKGERAAAERLCAVGWEYRRVGHDRRAMRFLPDGRVGEGAAGCEVYWDVRRVQGRLRLEVFSPEWRTFSAWEDEAGGWVGRWERFEGMRVELVEKAEGGGRKAEEEGAIFAGLMVEEEAVA